jgi:hypothetical protein
MLWLQRHHEHAAAGGLTSCCAEPAPHIPSPAAHLTMTCCPAVLLCCCPAESTLRLLCKVFAVETATVSLLTGERIYLVGACGALPVSIQPPACGTTGQSWSVSCAATASGIVVFGCISAGQYQVGVGGQHRPTVCVQIKFVV